MAAVWEQDRTHRLCASRTGGSRCEENAPVVDSPMPAVSASSGDKDPERRNTRGGAWSRRRLLPCLVSSLKIRTGARGGVKPVTEETTYQ